MSETSVKLFLATKMKCAVVSALISLAFLSQASIDCPFSRFLTLSDHGASFGFSANVSRRMRANHGANPKGSKERRMNDTQALILIHTIAWPILIWAL